MCMCGDTMCPSCGPAQGYDPAFETLCDAILNWMNPDTDAGSDAICDLLTKLGAFPRLANLIVVLAHSLPDRTASQPLTPEEIAKVNAALDAIRPCKTHGEWPDPEYGCLACYADAEAEADRCAEEWRQEELREEGRSR